MVMTSASVLKPLSLFSLPLDDVTGVVVDRAGEEMGLGVGVGVEMGVGVEVDIGEEVVVGVEVDVGAEVGLGTSVEAGVGAGFIVTKVAPWEIKALLMKAVVPQASNTVLPPLKTNLPGTGSEIGLMEKSTTQSP